MPHSDLDNLGDDVTLDDIEVAVKCPTPVSDVEGIATSSRANTSSYYFHFTLVALVGFIGFFFFLTSFSRHGGYLYQRLSSYEDPIFNPYFPPSTQFFSGVRSAVTVPSIMANPIGGSIVVIGDITHFFLKRLHDSLLAVNSSCDVFVDHDGDLPDGVHLLSELEVDTVEYVLRVDVSTVFFQAPDYLFSLKTLALPRDFSANCFETFALVPRESLFDEQCNRAHGAVVLQPTLIVKRSDYVHYSHIIGLGSGIMALVG